MSGSEGVTPLTILLEGDEFGRFSGCRVSTLLSGLVAPTPEAAERLRRDLARLIQAGRILWTEPGQELATKDLFDAQRRPYMGVVRWSEGQPTIERVTIAT